MTKHHITTGSIFDDLKFSSEEARHLKIRAALMRSLEQYIKTHQLKQLEASEILGISQPRVSDLLRGKITKFSIDQLVKMHDRIDIKVALVIDDRLVA